MREQKATGTADVHAILQEDTFMGFTLEELRSKKHAAYIGYLSINLYDPPKEATWGKHNDRTVNPGWVSQLVKDFAKRVDNCTNEDALEVAVRRAWVKNIDLVLPMVNDKTIGDVPEIEFTREGMEAIQPDNLVMLGGNHRRLAVKIFVDTVQKQLEQTSKKRDEKASQAHKQSDVSGTTAQELKKLEGKVEWLEKKLKSSQHWVIALYDIGTHE
jgi:hypothetical protein